MRSELPNFEAASGLKVEYLERDWAKQREDILAALTAGEVPDVVRTHNKYVAEFGDTGDLKALEDFEDFAQVADTFVPSFLANTEHDGQHYGLPEVALPFILAVNQPMLDAAAVAVPTNWDEFKAAAQTLTKPDQGVYGYTIPGGVNLDAAYRFAPWLYKAGGRFLNDDWSEATFNGPAGVAALEMLLDLQKQGAIPPGNAAYAFAENADVWASQKAAMSTEGPWWQGVISGEQYKLDLSLLTIAPVPVQPEPVGGNPPGTLLDLTMLAVMDKGKNVEGAWEFLKYFRSPEMDALKVDPLITDGLPTTKRPYEDPAIEWTFVGKETYLQELNSVVTWPNHPNITEIQLKVAEALNAAFSGASSAQDALDAAAEDVNDILEG
jgi:multiple sugar transport system substrate-binding protein